MSLANCLFNHDETYSSSCLYGRLPHLFHRGTADASPHGDMRRTGLNDKGTKKHFLIRRHSQPTENGSVQPKGERMRPAVSVEAHPVMMM
jgi:hypothetical protein